jgi:hypothetical protein
MKRRLVCGFARLTVVAWFAIAASAPAAAGAQLMQGFTSDEVYRVGRSDAVSIPVLTGSYYLNSSMAKALPYWWDHTNLTVAVESAPTSKPEDIAAVHAAIAEWRKVLAAQLAPISMTDLSLSGNNAHSADIVIHFVDHYGGVKKGGNATCGTQKCFNITVKAEQPNGQVGAPDIFDFDPLRVERETLHELGHALGLGHAEPLLQSTDIMAYGWAVPDPDVKPIISTCDIAGIKIAFGWYFDQQPPQPSPIPSVTCLTVV